MTRYSMAGVAPPQVLYVDRDCCAASIIKTKELFDRWPDLLVRLDIWHFMRHLPTCCMTESHPLYGEFMSRMSQCIFHWREEDLDLLKNTKHNELLQEVRNPGEAEVIDKISKRELALHCHRKTHGTVETTELLHSLLLTFSGPQGCNTLGVPLLDKDLMWRCGNRRRYTLPAFKILMMSSFTSRLDLSPKAALTYQPTIVPEVPHPWSLFICT